ncbi:MAG: hypothetical protein HY329_20925 [Chloroflexi bacterium]|nr:hypothetical protein [Chloroflexota bacterium]
MLPEQVGAVLVVALLWSVIELVKHDRTLDRLYARSLAGEVGDEGDGLRR